MVNVTIEEWYWSRMMQSNRMNDMFCMMIILMFCMYCKTLTLKKFTYDQVNPEVNFET